MYPNCTLIQKHLAYHDTRRFDYVQQAPIYIPPPYYAQAPAPAVSLSQVPYTGLDLGVGGTVTYWAFLIFWGVLAAYLLIVKRVQNRLADHLGSVLFGTPVAAA